MKKSAPRSAKKPADEKPVALTVKIDSHTYVRLSTLRAKKRKTAQEILTEALKEYLDRERA
jgi:predicted transcriptional regulator